MYKKKYMIFADAGVLHCIDNYWNEVKNWGLHSVNGKGTCLFIDNAFICKATEMRFVGLTDAEYNSIVSGTFAADSAPLWSKKTSDINGNTVITSKRKNGEIVETVLDKDFHIVGSKIYK